ncbi:MAG: hypothetical protein WD802_03295 [Gemmatimonadaceae bacterium]
MIRKPLLLCTAGFVFALAACETFTGLSGSEISQADANELAAALDENATLGASDFGLGPSFSMNVGENASAAVSVPVMFNNDFSVTKQCPRGGQVVIAGTISGTSHRATHDLSVHAVASRTDANCAFQTRRGVLTLYGNPDIDYDGNLNIVAGQLSGVQTQTHKGSFTWTRAGVTNTCDVDLTSSYNPETRTATVSGTFCGHTVDISRTRG